MFLPFYHLKFKIVNQFLHVDCQNRIAVSRDERSPKGVVRGKLIEQCLYLLPNLIIDVIKNRLLLILAMTERL